MGIKSKIFGFVAAAALTLSMSAGIASAQSTGTVKLDATQCETTPTFGTAFGNFGVWKYDGVSGYSPDSGSATSTLYVNVTKVPAPDKKCAVTIAITQPLTNNIEEIPNSNFTLGHDGQTGLSVPHTFQQPVATESYDMTLNSVPAAASTGTYKGTITLTVSNGS